MLTFNSRQNIFDISSYQDWFNMKTKNYLVMFLLVAIFSSATSQRESFSQRRQRLLNEKRRQQELANPTTTTPVPTIPPTTSRPMTLAGRLNQAARNVLVNDDVEFVAKMSTYLNWEEFLSPIPTSLGVLATLLMSAGQTDDFPLNDNGTTPIGGFHYMKYPESFRLSLLQISQESFGAFLTAHVNMDKIRISTQTLPDYMKMAVDILSSGNMERIRNELHLPLKVVKMSIDENLIWSSEVVDRFNKLANLTDEVHLAAVSSNKEKTDRRSMLITQQATSQLTVNNLQELIDNLGKKFKKDLSQHFRAVDDLVEAYKSLPTSFDSFFMDVGQFVVQDVIGTIVKGIKKLKGDGRSPEEAEEKDPNSEDDTSIPPPDPCLYNHHSSIFNVYARSQTLFNQYSTLQSIDSGQGIYNATADTNELTIHLQNTTQCKPIKQMIEMGIESVQQLHQLAFIKEMPSIGHEILSHIEPKDRFLQWRQDQFIRARKSLEEFSLEANALKNTVLNIPDTDITSTNITHPGQKSRASKQAKAHAEYRIAVHTESLKVLREAVDRNLKLIIKKTEESVSILNQIHSWKTEEIGMNRAIEMLQIGMSQLSQLKENWGRLVRFFVRLSQLIETIAGKSLDDFKTQLETTVESSSFKRSGKLKKLIIQNIRNKVTRANQASSMVYGMASTYHRVSTDYLMPRVQQMDTMMRFDSSFDLVVQRALLTKSCADDELKIGQLIAEEMQRLIERIQERERQIKREYSFLDEMEEKDIEEVHPSQDDYDNENVIDIDEF